eukprot:scaffold10202_cov38-Cyclotella_meneghiniana.AAC.5
MVTVAIDCWGETSPIHLLGFALKLDIDEVRANPPLYLDNAKPSDQALATKGLEEKVHRVV